MVWLLWLGGALLLAVLEIFTLDLLFIMLAAGAAAGAIGAAAGLPLVWQIVLAAAVALLMMFALRPFLLRHLRTRVDLVETNVAAMTGKPGTVLQPTDGAGGRVKIGGEVWSARTEDGDVLAAGDQVRVTRIDGATAVVTHTPVVTAPVDEPGAL
ncbi:NfeD family protein [Cellulomonas sp. RIT-PI-Y]|uniref:NfeD family protein n=1 Tax=Cellulomonas sp. RIT-PI-Y TaxID=3035297 RepID=UPI0021DB2ED1|nr:NfeD family protein [Cellulomonas sp. RIT-PI-Y]